MTSLGGTYHHLTYGRRRKDRSLSPLPRGLRYFHSGHARQLRETGEEPIFLHQRGVVSATPLAVSPLHCLPSTTWVLPAWAAEHL